MERHEETETSPLLAKPTSTLPDLGLDPNSVPPGEFGATGHQHGDTKPAEDEESQSNSEDRGHQYEGMPDVKAKLCYLLTLSSFQPLYGKMSDIFGRKPCLLFAYAIFGLGCLWCGLARNMNELIVARAFAGIGGGGMTTVVSIMMSDIVPLRERGTWQGILNIIYALGAGCGAPLGMDSLPQVEAVYSPVVGGLLADRINWRWAFLAQGPVCAAAFLSVALVLKLPKQNSSDWKTKLRRIDFLGAFVLVAAIFLLLLGLDRGSNNSWSAPITITSLCVSFPLFCLFIFVELKLAAEPFAPGRIIFKRSLVACYLCNFFGFGGWLAVLFYIPLFYQAVDGFSATQAGLRLLPNVLAAVSGSLTGGLLMQKTGKYYWLTVVAISTSTLGTLLIILCTGLVVNNTYGISVGLVLGGFCTGIGTTTTLIGLIANAAPEDQAIATACSYLFRSLGSVVILSLTASVVQQSLRDQLRERLNSEKDAEEIVKRVRESLDYVKTLKPAVREAVRQCYANSTRNGFGFILGTACCAMLASLFIREKRLGR
ncbi:MAG: hypothetical protein ASARMPREDX12_007212 [Alectoria sarmentosa]|nr:MAG: hypothetical protein ASARMPREDX12_007212 [Alectoria sarmentosa]